MVMLDSLGNFSGNSSLSHGGSHLACSFNPRFKVCFLSCFFLFLVTSFPALCPGASNCLVFSLGRFIVMSAYRLPTILFPKPNLRSLICPAIRTKRALGYLWGILVCRQRSWTQCAIAFALTTTTNGGK